MDRAWEMLGYLGENPTADEILAAYHLKPKEPKFKRPKTQQEALGQLNGLAKSLAGGVEMANRLPPQLKDIATWALEQQKLMHGKPN